MSMAFVTFAAFLNISFDPLFYGSNIACNELSERISHVVSHTLYVILFALLLRHWTAGYGMHDVKRTTEQAIHTTKQAVGHVRTLPDYYQG